MQGQTSFQITGEAIEQDSNETEEQGISEQDIKTIMEKTGCSEKKARKSLEKTDNNLAEAIIELSK